MSSKLRRPPYHRRIVNEPARPRTLLICLLLAATTFVAFSPILSNGFVNFDDLFYIVENPNVNQGFSSGALMRAFTQTLGANWHPLTVISHIIDCQLFGLNASRHHLVGLLSHTLTSVLLLLVMRRMTDQLWPSAFVAGVFALHPMHVESVAWASERKDVLSALFWVWAMGCYALYVQRASRKWFVLTHLAFVLGLLSKPMVVTFPAVMLLIDFWPLQRFSEGISLRRLIVEKIPMLVLAIVFSAIAVATQRDTGALPGVAQLPIGFRISNAARAYCVYIGKTFWPTKLAVFYPYPHSLSLAPTLACAAALLGASGIAILFRRFRPYVFTGWFWVLGTLLPTIGIIQVGQQSRADRYMYLPMIGLAMIVAFGASDLLRRSRWIAIGRVAGIGVLGACAIATWQTTHYWHSSVDLWERAVAVTTDNATAHHNLGVALVEAQRPGDALEPLRRAIALNRQYVSAYTNLSKALQMLGDLDGARQTCMDALAAMPNEPALWTELGHVLSARGNLPEAAAAYEKACQIDPHNAMYAVNFASALAEQGKFAEAIRLYQIALNIDPNLREAQVGLARAMQDRDKGTPSRR